jgi:chemotaxis protein methyltransferase CheR
VTREDTLAVGDTLRGASTFVLRDAMIGPPPGSYEIIVCKNVLIYFGDDAAERVLTLLMRTLADDGLLLVAKSEVPRVRALGHRAEEIAPGVSVFRA